MPDRELVVMGGSLGSLRALRQIVAGLSSDFPAPVLVVQHLLPNAHNGHAARILQKETTLPVAPAEHRVRMLPGHIYVAPANQHLTVDDHHMAVAFGPRVNGSRPAIDPLFYSAAHILGPKCVGVILSGKLDDGVSGLLAIQRAGGITVVQTPDDAEAPEMPRAALRYVQPDFILPAEEIGRTLSWLFATEEPLRGIRVMPDNDNGLTGAQPEHSESVPVESGASQICLVCPDCGGGMQRVPQPGPPYYACHVGHSMTGETLHDEQLKILEKAMWFTTRTLKEIMLLSSDLSKEAERIGDSRSAARFSTNARFAEKHLAHLHGDLAKMFGGAGGELPVSENEVAPAA